MKYTDGMKHVTKTNALRILDSLKTAYEAVEFETEGAVSGVEAAARMGVEQDYVYKTLVTVGKSGANYVFVIPVAEELDLKKAAFAAGEKNVSMLPSKMLLPLTGYVHGGCSPVGMKKQFPTFIDESAVLLESIFVSGGRIGLQIKISPDDLAGAVEAKFTALCSER